MKKYLITGFAGFVGRHFLEYLDDLGIQALILGIDRQPAGFDINAFRHLKCAFTKADLLKPNEWAAAIDEFRPDYILHLASFSSVAFSWANPIDSFSNNTNVFLNLLEKVRATKLKCRILSVGSSEEYGDCSAKQLPLTEDTPLNPASPYAAARVSQELLSKVYVSGFGSDIVMTRSFNHIGPGQLDSFVVSSFARQLIAIKNGSAAPTIVTGDTSIVRDFVDVRDVVRAYDDLMKHGKAGEVYNICGGTGVSLSHVIKRMCAILDISVTQVIDPQRVRINDNKSIVGSYKKIHDEIGWQPRISLDQSLKEILRYWHDA